MYGNLIPQVKKPGDKPGINPEHCAIGKIMSSRCGLIEHVKLDNIKVPNGMQTMDFFPENLKTAMKKQPKKCEPTREKRDPGNS